jgi:hypothetical protein
MQPLLFAFGKKDEPCGRSRRALSDFFWASLDGELGRIIDAVKRKCYVWGVDNCNGYPSTESEG